MLATIVASPGADLVEKGGTMPLVSKRGLVALALVAGVGIAAVSISTAQAAIAPSAAGPSQNVIVVLHDQHTDLAIAKGHASPRVDANRKDQGTQIAKAKDRGAKNLRGFDTVNAFAATVTPDEASQIAADPAVAAVYPDLLIKKSPPLERSKPAAARPPTVANSGICPTDPTKPLLEPEALQVTNTAFLDPATPQAQNLVTGAGVKVAFLADGLDPNNQDFIRADGSHVFVDYQDFSGDGPNAVTGAAEAFGDASSIASQGLHTYSLNDFVNPAHALPAGCTITVRGMAPGASLVGLKVFGNAPTAPTSRFIEAIDYAVNTAGVDVINESFGGNPFPDNGNDPISLADNAAVDAGVTVVASTGDAGTNGTSGSPATGSKIIGVAGTTTFRSYQQEGYAGVGFSNGTWVDNNISSLSSGGVSQSARVPDLAAPGDLGWALCSANTDVYEECTNDGDGAGSPIQNFGGTSMSSPLVAGAAALVIQAYEKTHGGVRPAPALVKRLLTSTAKDLGHPAFEQGAGLVDSLAAVQAAESWKDGNGSPAAQGSALVVDKTQLSLVGNPGATSVTALSVRNVSNHLQIVKASTRTMGKAVTAATGSVNLNTATAPSYIDATGIVRSYVEQDFTVPSGKDRMDVSIADASPISPGRIILVDPKGSYEAYSIPQGVAQFGHVDIRFPLGGKWKAFFALSKSSGFNGPILYAVTTSNFTTQGTASPSTLVLLPGGTGTVFVNTKLPNQPSDVSASVQLTALGGDTTSVPMTLRAVIPARNTTFTGVITGGNGRQFLGAQANIYYLDVPNGKKDLSLGVTFPDPNEIVIGVLTAPDGQVSSFQSNADVDGAGNLVTGNGLQIFRRNPTPGRWTFSFVVANPVSGLELSQPFTAQVAYDTVKIKANLPTNAHAKLKAGVPVDVPVTITNTGAAPLTFFSDGRLDTVGDIPLAELSGVPQPIALPMDPSVLPQWLVPTETSKLTVAANADQPVNLDINYNSGEPEKYSAAQGNGATVKVNAAQVSPGLWLANVGQTGPFADGGSTPGQVTLAASSRGQLFDPAVTSNAFGDLWTIGVAPSAATASTLNRMRAGAKLFARQTNVSAKAGSAAMAAPPSVGPGPVSLAPGESATITVTITPAGPVGSVVRGHLYIDSFNFFTLGGDELIDLPYAYTIG
jgi:hypothetical protein